MRAAHSDYFKRLHGSVWLESAANRTNSTWETAPLVLPHTSNISKRFEETVRRTQECNLFGNGNSVWQKFLHRNSVATWQKARSKLAKFFPLQNSRPPPPP